MRRLALIVVVVLLAAGAAAAVIGTGSSKGAGGPYLVRAIFDDASFAVPGEDVRIAGAPVGSIDSLCALASRSCGETPKNKAAVTLEIDNSSFAPFHANATCAIRPQSLIGEEYVDCSPGTSSAPPLTRITSGPGAGQYYLPVTQTSSPVDFDIVQDIAQEPVRQSLAIIIDELGTGLAARGSDLNAVIHRANPALGYTDQVFQILARQNRQLAQLATDADTVLAPLAQDRGQLADFVAQANSTSVATAARAAALARTFQLFPSFLRQLQPLMADLGTLADQGTPVMMTLGQSAADLGREFENLAPFATAARSALSELGATAAQSQQPLVASVPLAQRLQRVGNATLPTANLLDQLTTSLYQTGAIDQLMATLFYGTAAGNGFDSVGHYVRVEPLVSSCTNYATSPVPGCSANFGQGGGGAPASGSAARAAAARRGIVAAALRAVAGQSRPAASLKGLLRYLIGDR